MQVFKFIKEKGSISNSELDAALGPVAKIGPLAAANLKMDILENWMDTGHR